MSISINQIVNGNVYINGNSQMGRANEVKIPDVEFEKFSTKAWVCMVQLNCLPARILLKQKSRGIASILKCAR